MLILTSDIAINFIDSKLHSQKQLAYRAIDITVQMVPCLNTVQSTQNQDKKNLGRFVMLQLIIVDCRYFTQGSTKDVG